MVIKDLGIFVAAVLMVAVPCQADWLEGGYVSSGNSDIGKYFTDPIFRSTGSSYVSSDPAVREMQQSLDRPLSLGSVVSRPSSKKGSTGLDMAGVTGRWSLVLSRGQSIYLELFQSGSKVFGRGSIVKGAAAQDALASGTVSAGRMSLDVVSEDGRELYSFSVDLRKLNLRSSYSEYGWGIKSVSGTAKVSRLP